MSRELKKDLKIRGEEVTPKLDLKHLKRALFLASLLFVASLLTGIFTKSLGFLCESLFIITLSWGVYRGNFSAILLLSVYVVAAKIYQLVVLTELPLILRLASLLIALLFLHRFYLGYKQSVEVREAERRIFGLLDAVFVLTISLASISISAFAINWYG